MMNHSSSFMQIVAMVLMLVFCVAVHSGYASTHGELERRAEQGNADAQYLLARNNLLTFSNNKQCYKTAVQWLTKATRQNHFYARCLLAVLNKDDAAKSELKKDLVAKSASKELEALLHLGFFAFSDRNEKEALSYFEKLAGKKDPGGQFLLASLYYHGLGVARDKDNSLKLLQKAADQGHVDAQYTLGDLFAVGHDIPQDERKAFALFMKAAKQGDAEAQCRLGIMYARGSGVPRDASKAAEWLQKAADQGDAAAQYRLGRLYEQGRGVPEDEGRALELFQKAAEQGHQPSIKALPRLTSGGIREEATPQALPESGQQSFTNSIGMEFVRIPPGSSMSSDKSDDMEFIHKAFYLGKYEVTQKQWEAVMGSNPSEFKNPASPVDNVSAEDVRAFIKRLNAKEKHARYRLPAGREWQYAARGGADAKIFFIADPAPGSWQSGWELYMRNMESALGDYAWFANNSNGTTHPVGQKKPNPFGLYDIYGNVGEQVDMRIQSMGVMGVEFADLGCTWRSDAEVCISTMIHTGPPEYRSNQSGFRLALAPEDAGCGAVKAFVQQRHKKATPEHLAKAEDIIKKYVRKKYAWDDAVYAICIDTILDGGARVHFLVFHQDDTNLTSLGGGKSFLVEFYMPQMRFKILTLETAGAL